MASENGERAERFKSAINAAYFIDTYCVIDATDAEGELVGTAPFRLWPDQRALADQLATVRMLLILKSRQLGISWLVCAYVLWKCLFHDMQTVLLLSKDKDAAKELIGRIQKMYDRLPDWLRGLLPRQTAANAGDLGWANGSRVKSMAATEGSGRTYTSNVVVMDEADYMKYGRQVYASVRPTMEAAGQIIILSTANDPSEFLEPMWNQARLGRNDFTRVFLPWWSKPGRDLAWYARELRNSDDPRRMKKDYPANDIEAFTSTGANRFDPEWVEAQVPNTLEAPIPAGSWSPAMHRRPGWPGCPPDLTAMRSVPGLRVYREPVPGRRYLLAADVAECRDPSDSDFDSAVLVDCETLEEMADLHGQWEPKAYALYLMALSEPYRAVVMPERNAVGQGIISVMRLVHFPRIGLGADNHWGWHTNVKTKPEGVDLLAQHLKEHTATVRTRDTLAEFQTFVRKPAGKLEAREGFHDDRVMKWVIAVASLQSRQLIARKRTVSRGYNPVGGYRG